MIKKVLLVSLACVAMAYGGSMPRIGHQSRIVGGQEAEPHAYPWQISLQYKDFLTYYHTCGATIVDEYHIVCAAHCVDGRKASHFRVIAGAHNIGSFANEDGHQKRFVSEFWRHENYDHHTISNDISVLKLDEPLQFDDFVKPVQMAESEPEEGTVCINSGWGSTSTSNLPSMPNKLHFVEVPIIGRETCQGKYQGINVVDQGMICAGVEHRGPCSGDSGGPLVCPVTNSSSYELVGAVSWGMIPCGQPKYPGVFTNVANFRSWIDDKLAK